MIKRLIDIVKTNFSQRDARSAKAIRNVVEAFMIKGVSMVINLALIPLTINYLNPFKYGIWLTISSTLGWINFFDIGLGHGLRNKVAESLASNNLTKAKAYISTAYVSISILCIGLFIIFYGINHFIDWNSTLNIPEDIGENMKLIVLIVFSMFSIQFILQLINSILLGNQQSSRVSLNNVIANIFVLLGIVILMKYSNGSLLYIAFLFSTIPVLILFGVNVFYFRTTFKDLSPSIKSFDLTVLKDVLNLGIKFFVIQITVLIFYSTTNFLICRWLKNPELVTPYNIAYRYFNIISMLFSIMTLPTWSATTEAYAMKDFDWIRRLIKKMVRVWYLVAIGGVLMLLVSGYAYEKLGGGKVKVDFAISVTMMIYVVVISYGNVFILILNGVGRVRLQMIVNAIGMIVFFPLAYLLSVKLNLGVPGIIIATTICSVFGPLIAPIEVKRLLRNK